MKKNNAIKAVIFDLGNVLINYDVHTAARNFSKISGISEKEIWRRFFLSNFEQSYTRGEITTREFYLKASEALGIKIPFKTFCHYWNNIFCENNGMAKLLSELKKNYPLYLISNTNELHFNYVRKQFNILKFFKRTFPSHKIGARKPDPKIYRRVLRQINLKPQEVIFIDDMKSFVAGAKRVGIYAVRFQSVLKLRAVLKKIGIRF